ncbi:MAG TPA: hypothetical protein VG755_29065 [Nannocystaceae bacterium]|nr:hypothetical protein [Nannocystaceae bacterium]
MTKRTWILGAALVLAACKAEQSGGNETACETVCRRAGEAEATCAPDDCVETCEMPLPTCDAENRAYVECLAGAQLLGCLNHTEPTALGECDVQQNSLQSCLVGNGSTGDEGSSDDGGEAESSDDGGEEEESGEAESSTGDPGPCDPLDASCVACGDASCGAAMACCWGDAPSCGTIDACTTAPRSSCDGNEDCAGAQCCVSMSIDGTTANVTGGDAACSGGGGGTSTCCTATPGVPGCGSDPTVESCVCAQDDFCCTTEWDATCTAEIVQFGCGTCAAGCEVSNGTTGSGYAIDSVACRTSADCAGVVGEFGVPYGTCCSGNGYGIGACVSETFVDAITTAGGTCS